MKKLTILSFILLLFLIFPFVSKAQFVIMGDSITTTYVSLDPDSVCQIYTLPGSGVAYDTVFIDIDNNGVNDFRLYCVSWGSPMGSGHSITFGPINGGMVLSLLSIGNVGCDSTIDSVITTGSLPDGDSIFIYQTGLVSQFLPMSVHGFPWCLYYFGIASYPAYIPFQMQSGNNIFVGWLRFNSENVLDSYAYNSIPVSVPENSEIQYSIYPNPVMNEINVRFELTGRFNITFKDITGRTIFSQIYEGNHFQMDLGKFSDGIYLLEIESGQTRVSEKIVIR